MVGSISQQFIEGKMNDLFEKRETSGVIRVLFKIYNDHRYIKKDLDEKLDLFESALKPFSDHDVKEALKTATQLIKSADKLKIDTAGLDDGGASKAYATAMGDCAIEVALYANSKANSKNNKSLEKLNAEIEKLRPGFSNKLAKQEAESLKPFNRKTLDATVETLIQTKGLAKQVNLKKKALETIPEGTVPKKKTRNNPKPNQIEGGRGG